MAPELLLLWLAPPIVAFFLYILPQRRRTKGKPCNLPPGSTWCLPFLGETIAFLKPREATTIGKYLKEHIARYGRIFRSNVFGEMMIVSADPELNRFVLQNEGKEFRSSYPKHVEEVLGRWTKMELEGSLQKELRRIAVAFWTRVRLREVLVGDVERHALLVVRSLPVDVPFPAKEQVRRFTFNVIVGHCLGMHGENSKTERLKVEFAKFLNNFVSLPIKFPGTTYWKCLKSRANILKVIDEEIKERIQKPRIKTSEIETHDLLGFAMDADLSSELIHDLILNMIFGGHETTTTAITFAIYFLGRSPKALEELRREHLEIVEKKKLRRESTLTWEDYKQMDFTHCVINETLRLGNTLRFLERKAIRDVHYKDDQDRNQGYTDQDGELLLDDDEPVALHDKGKGIA